MLLLAKEVAYNKWLSQITCIFSGTGYWSSQAMASNWQCDGEMRTILIAFDQ